MNGFFFSCTAEICFVKLGFSLKVFWQTVHSNCLLFSWTEEMCMGTWPYWVNFLPQMWQLRVGFSFRGLLSSWTAPMCLFNFPFSEKHFPQVSHSKGFLSSWTAEMWADMWLRFENIFEHTGQESDFFFVVVVVLVVVLLLVVYWFIYWKGSFFFYNLKIGTIHSPCPKRPMVLIIY